MWTRRVTEIGLSLMRDWKERVNVIYHGTVLEGSLLAELIDECREMAADIARDEPEILEMLARIDGKRFVADSDPASLVAWMEELKRAE